MLDKWRCKSFPKHRIRFHPSTAKTKRKNMIQSQTVRLCLLWSAESWASMLHQSSSLVMNIANFLWVSRGPLAGPHKRLPLW